MKDDSAPAGPIVQTIDNAGVITQTQSDLAGRTMSTIQNYVAAGLDCNGLPIATDTAQDVTTGYQYDFAGRLVTQTAYNANGTTVVAEATKYLYESPLDGSLQTNEVDPDSTDAPAAVAVSLTQANGVATATTTAPNSYLRGDWVLIQGAADAGYNGWFQVSSVLSPTSFTYAVADTALTPDSGTAQALVAWNTVTSLTWDNSNDTATVSLSTNPYTNGEWVSIQGAEQSEFNGWFKVANATSTQFTFALSSASVSTASGTIRVRLMNDETQTTYDLAGEVLTSTDQRGVTHAYAYNSDGQQTSDAVTNFGSIPNGAGKTVAAIVTGYDDVGNVLTVTSYNTAVALDWVPANIVNQIQYAYDGWGNETREWQALTGAVDTGSTPSVQYLYDDGGVGGVAAYVRLTVQSYPNVGGVSYGYGNSGAVDYIMGQLATITDSTGILLAQYTYLGAGTIASEDLEQPQIELDYSAGNFAALDRFGNVLDQVWASNGGNSGNLATPLDGYTYTYNRSGNRTSQENLTDNVLSEVYTYDNLDRLTSAERGAVSDGAIVGTPSDTQTWTLDSLGNFTNSSDNTSTQARSVDPANEIQSISGAATPVYDLAGNMTTTPDPQPGAEGTPLTCVYDAWDRLVEVSNSSGELASYQYDGTGRRIVEFINFTGSVAGTVTYSYFSGQNAIETRTGSAASSPESLPVQYQYVFSPLGVKTPLVRDTYVDGEISSNDRLYYLTDANTNVTAVVGLSGSTWQVQERYAYDPYGAVTMYDGTVSTSGHWVDPHTVSSVGNTTLYASMVLDPVTGLYNDEARWYSTAVSGFISTDPAQADENTYRYCGNMPTQAIDPSGEFAITIDFNAFIPSHLGTPLSNASQVQLANDDSSVPTGVRWFPGPFGYYYETDTRDQAGTPGTSRIHMTGTFDSAEIGDLKRQQLAGRFMQP